MATIVSATIEASGWVLALTINGVLSSTFVGGYSLGTDTAAQWATNFGAYALTPNATPKLTLACSNAIGFAQTTPGAAVVANTAVARNLVVTRVLRKVVVATAAGVRDAKNPDEANIGGGQIVVRIALSQHAYAGETYALTALTGWWLGSGAAAGTESIAVTNASTVPAPAPIVRWTDVPYQLQSGSFALECAVVSHHPNALAPVAGVKFTATDGTTIKTFWATALSTSTAYSAGGTGLGLRVYSVTVDPTTATALTKGLLRCDFKAFPWIGPAQVSDTADTNLTAVAASNTPSMTALGTVALATAAQVPFVVAYNPSNSWIVPRYAYVDPAGSTTAAASSVSTNSATAAATPLANIHLAIESLRLFAVATPAACGSIITTAANGQAVISQSIDGCRIRLIGAIHSAVGTAVTFGVNTGATWLVIEGDPANANPVANCILRSPSTGNAASWQNVTRIRFTGLSTEANSTGKFGYAPYAWCDNFEFRNQTPTDTSAYYPFSTSPGLIWATNGKWWKCGAALAKAGSQHNPVLVRNVAVERQLGAAVVVNNARLATAVALTVGVTGDGTNVTDAGVGLDRLAIGNDLRYLNGAPAFSMQNVAFSALPAGLVLGKTYPAASRHAFVNNVGEIYGAATPLWFGTGENTPVVASENIVEGNTFVGDRVNAPFYNVTTLPTVAQNDIEDSQARVNRYANNVTLKNAIKGDTFNEPAVQAQRIGVTLASTRNRAYVVYAAGNPATNCEIVVAGAPANIYRCTVAGTTAATGGPTGTGTAIVDGGVTWQWIATEARQHGYRPQQTGMFAMAHGVGFEGNIDLESANDSLGSIEYLFEFYGIGGRSLYADGITIATGPFTLDKSGTSNKQPYQATPDGTGGGNYKPLATGSGAYTVGRGKTANVDVDQLGVARSIPFTAGALEALLANLTRMLMGIGS